jgi:hypothetical protein
MARKDIPLIPSPKTCFVQPAKLMLGDSLIGKISLGINFPLCYTQVNMKNITIIFLLLAEICAGQAHEKFLSDFLLEDELKPENVLSDYNRFDFSGVWSQTENYQVLGIIGSEYQRIKIKLISFKKINPNSNEYFVIGKSNVKGTICDFKGTIQLREIKEVKKLHFGVDEEYKNSGIKSEGILIAEYEFKENPKQIHSGVFRGQLFTKWYLNSNNQIQYDDIQSISDEYMNNAFIGIWVNNSTHKKKICNWADYRVPEVSPRFDIGAAEFSPSENYYERGWENYQKAWLSEDIQAQEEERHEWWK